MPRIRTLAQAGKAIDRLGFCLLFPNKGVLLPSLIEEATDRKLRSYNPRTDWSDDFLRVWKWKDELPRKRLAWYGKYFRGRGLFLSPQLLACFYCLEGNHPSRNDGGAYERLYRAGRITADARTVAAELQESGPRGTLELRYSLGWGSKRGNLRFKRAMAELQARLMVTHFGAQAETRAWQSAVYQLTPRAFPKAVRTAAKLSPEEARRHIAGQYRKHYPKVSPPQLARLFRWPREEAQAALAGSVAVR